MKKIKTIVVLTILISMLLSLFAQNNFFITVSSSNLGLGSRGSTVEDLQQKLKNWGYYDGNIDGKYDVKTFLAVMNFQKDSALSANGIADEDTLMAMGITRVTQSGAAYAEGGYENEVQLLARAINGEARGEPYEGQVAVGAVIMNRTRNASFPKTITGVIYQPGAFTAVSDGQINVPMDANSTVVKAARDALTGWDPTDGCIYYWNPATATSKWIWSRQIVKKIGKHNFGK